MKIHSKWNKIQTKRNWDFKKIKQEHVFNILFFEYKNGFRHKYIFATILFSICISFIFGFLILYFSYFLKETFFLFFQKETILLTFKMMRLWYWKNLFWLILLNIIISYFLSYLLSETRILFKIVLSYVIKEKRAYIHKNMTITPVYEYIQIKSYFLGVISYMIMLPFFIQFSGFLIYFICLLFKWFYHFTLIKAMALSFFCYYEFIYTIGLRIELLNELYLVCWFHKGYNRMRKSKLYKKRKKYLL